MMSTATSAAAMRAFELMQAGRHAEALGFAEQAVAGETRCVPAHGLMATLLLTLGRADEAGAAVDRALTLETGPADAYDGLAYVSMHLGKHEQATALYRRAAEGAGSDARLWYNLASSERGLGNLDAAEAACNRAIALDPGYFPSYLLRSELRLQTHDANHVDELRGLLQDKRVDERMRMFLGYALGKELDDLGDYDEAFGWFAQAATARRRNLSYDVAIDEEKMLRIEKTFSRPKAAVRGTGEGDRDGAADFIFITGLPRSGTTLLERLLLGLRGVTTNGETDNFARALLQETAEGPADIFARAAEADPAAVARGYERFARRQANGPIIEKLPMNYLYLGAIRHALPQAALLVVTRSPADSCFAMFRTLFGQAYPFSYDFEELARYYAAYDRLMRHWKQLFGEAVHEVAYRDLVTRTSEAGAAAARHCGLRWNEEAIDIDKNRAASFTASASQIRRPIYNSSVDRWRHYTRHLGPLFEALDRHGVVHSDDR